MKRARVKMRRATGIVLSMIIALAVFLVPGQSEVAYAANMIANPGYESGLWSEKTAGFTLDTSVKHGGSQSAKVSGTTSEVYMGTPEIAVNPYNAYRVTVWVSTDNISTRSGVSLNVLEVNSSGGAIGWITSTDGTMKLASAGGKQNWTKYTATLVNMNASTVSVKIYVRVDANVTGTVWVDDFSMDTINLVANEGFESGVWSEKTSGVTADTSEKHSGAQSAKVTAQSAEQYMASSEIPVKFDEQYKLSLWVKTTSVSTSAGVSVNVLQVDSSGGSLGWYPNGTMKLISTGGTQNWTKYEADLSGFAVGTVKLKVYVRTDADITGTVWFDDVLLRLKHKDNFMWGVTGHHGGTPSYPESQLSNQLQKAVDLGSTIYRINVDPPITGGIYDWTYMDNLVNTAHTKGLKLMVVMYDSLGGTTTELYNRAFDISSRYKGKIHYYQLGNEQDNNSLISSDYDGTSPSHYDDAKYIPIKDKINSLSTGVAAGDPAAKRVINIAYKHTGFLEKLNADGVVWEANAVDWYSDMGDILPTIDTLVSFQQSEVIVGENNIRPGTYGNTEQQQADYIKQTINQLYYHSSPKVSGYIEYELLDEPVLSNNQMIENFEDIADWTVDDSNAAGSTFERSTLQIHDDSYSGKVDYSFNTSGNDYVLLNKSFALGGLPTKLWMWVYGNNSGQTLAFRVQDTTGEVFQPEVTINWSGWSKVETTINHSIGGGDNDSVLDYPVSFVSLIVDDSTNAYTGSGTLYFDNLAYNLIFPSEGSYGLFYCDSSGNIGTAKIAAGTMTTSISDKQ